MDVTGDDTAQNLSAGQRDVMKLILRALSNKRDRKHPQPNRGQRQDSNGKGMSTKR
jgi:ribosomal protein L4